MARQIRFMAESEVDFVLWGPDDGDEPWEEQLGLSAQLRKDLQGWLENAQRHLQAASADKTLQARIELDLQGRELAGRVQDEAGERYNIVYSEI